MKNYILFGVFIFCVTNTIAQNKKMFTYYDYSRKYLHEEYFINQQTGKINGVYKEYDQFGKLNIKGSYSNGIRVGTWNTYFNDYSFGSTGGNSYVVKTETFNNKGILHGKYLNIAVSFNTATKGQYNNGNKDGIWEEYEGSQLVSKKLYKNGNLIKDLYSNSEEIPDYKGGNNNN